MSLKMIDYIVDEHGIDIDTDCLKKVKVKWIFYLMMRFYIKI